MNKTVLVGMATIILLVMVNISLAAYNFGRISQAVEDLSRRVDRIENILNHGGDYD